MVGTHSIEKALEITGWMSPAELVWLAEHAKNAHAILEFGSYYGRSTRALADNTQGIVVAVDPWNGRYYNNDDSIASWLNTNVLDAFLVNLKDHIDNHRVIWLKGYSEHFESPHKFDLIFIDGDHRYKTVKLDIEKALQYVAANGIIAGHDYNHTDWPGVKRAVDEYFKEVNVIESIWWVNV